MAGQDQDAALAELRGEIDRIDADMHGLLMERGRIIERLIAVKGGTAATGSAFRPEREAAMIRAMGARHAGSLPFDAVESIWRVIITTFTHLQAPFAVHVDVSGDGTAMRDSARFHFGFMVPLAEADGPASVAAAVAASRGDLGLVPLLAEAGAPWWCGLEAEGAPKVIARLPFVDRPDHPARRPVLVLAKSVSGEGLGAVALHSVRGLRDEGGLARLDGQVLARCGADALVAAPREAAAARIAALGDGAVIVGSHPAAS